MHAPNRAICIANDNGVRPGGIVKINALEASCSTIGAPAGVGHDNGRSAVTINDIDSGNQGRWGCPRFGQRRRKHYYNQTQASRSNFGRLEGHHLDR